MKESEYKSLGHTKLLAHINGMEESNRQLKALVESLEKELRNSRDCVGDIKAVIMGRGLF